MSKRKQKQLNNGHVEKQNNGLKLVQLRALTKNQEKAFNSYIDNNLVLYGSAGSGKSLLALYFALNNVLNKELYKKIIIVRSTVPSRDMGFLPGPHNGAKTKVYEAPYYGLCTELFNRGDSYDVLKNKGIIEFISTAFIRGITLNDCIVIVEESQNLESNELYAIITRMGENSKIIFTGDFYQTDLHKGKYDILKFMNILRKMKEFAFIEFTHQDIVRSKMVKSFIIEWEKYNGSTGTVN